jgi:peptidyl-prolyl cis-trans isomerase D
MIGWMQHHRKYLIVTIWISTIAFVGAGFVGWGSYNMTKSSNILATVGDYEVTNRNVNSEYSRLFSLYNEQFGGKLTDKLAKQFGLDKQAFNNVVSRKLILAYAYDMGFYPLKKEILKQIQDMPNFKNDGVFSQKIYYDILTKSGLSPKVFETGVGEDVMINKMVKSLEFENSKLEEQGIDLFYNIEDLLDVKVIDSKNIKIKANDKNLKDYYNQNKNQYMTIIARELEVIKIPYLDIKSSEKELKAHFEATKHLYRDMDGKIDSFKSAKENVQKDINYQATKKIANKAFYALKNNQRKYESIMTISKNDKRFSQNTIKKIFSHNIGTFIKPIAVPDYMLVSFVRGIKQPKQKTFAKAKQELKSNYIKSERVKQLHILSKKKFKPSDYKRLDYVSTKNTKPLKSIGINEELAFKFIQELFTSDKKESYIIVDDKSIVYKIIDQRYKNNNLQDLEDVNNISNMSDQYANNRNSSFQNDLISKLKRKYKVISYIKN